MATLRGIIITQNNGQATQIDTAPLEVNRYFHEKSEVGLGN